MAPRKGPAVRRAQRMPHDQVIRRIRAEQAARGSQTVLPELQETTSVELVLHTNDENLVQDSQAAIPDLEDSSSDEFVLHTNDENLVRGSQVALPDLEDSSADEFVLHTNNGTLVQDSQAAMMKLRERTSTQALAQSANVVNVAPTAALPIKQRAAAAPPRPRKKLAAVITGAEGGGTQHGEQPFPGAPDRSSGPVPFDNNNTNCHFCQVQATGQDHESMLTILKDGYVIKHGDNFATFINMPTCHDHSHGLSCPNEDMPSESRHAVVHVGLSNEIVRNNANVGLGIDRLSPMQIATKAAIDTGNDLVLLAAPGVGKTSAVVLGVLDELVIRIHAEAQARGFEYPPAIHGELQEEYQLRMDTDKVRPEFMLVTCTNVAATEIFMKMKCILMQTRVRVCLMHSHGHEGQSFRVQAEALKGKCDVLVASSGYAAMLLSEGYMSFDRLRVVFIDEVGALMRSADQSASLDHCLLSKDGALDGVSGNNVQRILADSTLNRKTTVLDQYLRHPIEDTPTIFTHTMQPGFISSIMFFKKVINSPDIMSAFYRECADFISKEYLRKTLIFVDTIKGADSLQKMLTKLNCRAETIHSACSNTQNMSKLWQFRTEGFKLIGCKLPQRALNIPHLDDVIFVDTPTSPAFVNGAGRVGRCGHHGTVTVLLRGDNGNAIPESQIAMLQMEADAKAYFGGAEFRDFPDALPGARTFK